MKSESDIRIEFICRNCPEPDEAVKLFREAEWCEGVFVCLGPEEVDVETYQPLEDKEGKTIYVCGSEPIITEE